jgi:hypothetical protein
MRHEFPTEWAKFTGVKVGGAVPTAELKLTVREEHFPYWSKGRLRTVRLVNLFGWGGKNGREIVPITSDRSVEVTTLKPDGNETKETVGNLAEIPLPQPPSVFSLKFGFDLPTNAMKDLWLALAWGA